MLNFWVVKNIKVKNSLVTKLALDEKTHHNKTLEERKKSWLIYLQNLGCDVFQLSKNLVSEVVLGSLNKGKPWFEGITEDILRWNLTV